MTCPSCGTAVPASARFCPECGTNLVQRPDERRLVTVLMADIVGFTSLSEHRDPEQVKELVDRCFERLVADVAAHGGNLDKIVGDELVATFGASVAHEDDAERAVRAALRMQQTLADSVSHDGRDLALRIGINTGEVLVGALRAGGDATVMGDVVNTASRLQTAAEPGRIVVGPATYRATRHAIRFDALGELTVRGRREPVEAWVAVDATAPPGRRTRIKGTSPLVGRDSELDMLVHALTHAVQRHRPLVVLISGEAGVGKTRMLIELGRVAIHQHCAQVLGGHCVPYGATGPWEPVAEALRHQLGIDAATPPDGVRAAVHEAVAATVPDHPAAEVERLVDGLLELLGASANPDVDPGRARDEAARALLTVLEALAADRPLVLGLSDVHWADDAVLDLVDRAVEQLRTRPVVIVATTRPGIEDRWRPGHGRVDTLHLHLEPLEGAATDQLARALLDDRAGPEVLAVLRERSGGNPLFVEELAALAREGSDGADDAQLAGRLRSLPATLHGLVAARLDALPTEQRRLLADLAVVGTSGPVAAVAALRDGDHAPDELHALVDLDLVEIDGDSFRFRSELVREVSYGTLAKAERARRHAALAPLFAALGDVGLDRLAHHLSEAATLAADLGVLTGVPADVRDQALRAVTAAAEHSVDAEHWLRAAQLWDCALTLVAPDDDERRWDALLGRAQGRAGQHDLDAAEDDARRVLDEAETAGNTRATARALNELGRVLQRAERFDEAEDAFATSASLWRELADARGVADALRGLGVSHLFRGDIEAAERLFSDALASYRGEGERRGEAWALQNLAWIAFNRGRTTEADARLSQSADLFLEIGDWGGLGWALGLLAWVRFMEGRLDEAEDLADRIELEARELGNRWATGMMGILLANIALWRGRIAEACARASTSRDLFRRLDDSWGQVQATAPLARCLAMLGQWEEYERTMQDLREVAQAVVDPGLRELPRTLAGIVAAQRGDGDAALHALGAHDPDDPARFGGGADLDAATALALLEVGRSAEARAILAPTYERATDAGPRAALAGLYAIALAATSDVPAAEAVLDDVASVDGTWRDRALAALARGLVAARRRDRAAAVAAFDAAGAVLDATDARVDQAVLAVVRAGALDRLGVASDIAPSDLARLVDEVGIDAAGWDRLVGDAIGKGEPV